KQWRRMCGAMDLGDLLTEPRFKDNDARVINRVLMNERIEARLSQQPRDFWIPLLQAAGVPAGPVNSVAEALDDEQVRANQMVLDMQHPRLGSIPTLGFPINFDRTPCEIRLPPPEAGEHTNDIRAARISEVEKR